MGDPVAVCGMVATRPRHVVPEAGAPITTFRLVTGRGQGGDGQPGDRTDRDGSSGEHNWYTVTARRELAVSAAACVARGDPLVVSGTLCVREWEGEPAGATVEIEARAIGHDLAWGRSAFTRSVVASSLAEHDDLRGVPTGPEP